MDSNNSFLIYLFMRKLLIVCAVLCELFCVLAGHGDEFPRNASIKYIDLKISLNHVS